MKKFLLAGSMLITVGAYAADPMPSGTYAIPGGRGASQAVTGMGFDINNNPVVCGAIAAVLGCGGVPAGAAASMATAVQGIANGVPLIVTGSATSSGTVYVNNFPATQPISGSVTLSGSSVVSVNNFPTTQAISGAVTISGTPTVSGSVSLSGFLPDTSGGALASIAASATSGATSALQTSGNTSLASITTNTGRIPALGSALRANSTPVTIASDQPAIPVSGTVTTVPSGTQAVSIATLPALTAGSAAIGSVTVSNLPATQPVSGTFYQTIQPVSGTVTTVPSGTQAVSIAALPALTAGSAAIGSVSVSNLPASQAVTGTFFQTTQPVSGTITTTPSGTQTISGAVSVTNFPATQAVSGTFFQATQPVSGTVTTTPAAFTLAYSATTTASITTASTTLATAAQYKTLVLCTLPASTTNVWLNPNGTAVASAGIPIFAGGGCTTFGTQALPMPTAAITAITDGGSTQTITLAGG